MSELNPSASKTAPPPEQVTYANLLFYGCWCGIFLMVFTYVICLSGLLTPYIPIDKLPEFWGNSVHNYVEKGKIPYGWGWTALILKGDFLNFTGIALLAGLTVIGFLTLIPPYLKKKDYLYTGIVIAEVLVLVLAASGILTVGGH